MRNYSNYTNLFFSHKSIKPNKNNILTDNKHLLSTINVYEPNKQKNALHLCTVKIQAPINHLSKFNYTQKNIQHHINRQQ